MKKLFCLMLVLICFLLPVFPDDYLSFGFGTAGFFELSDPFPIYPDLHILFGFDHFSALTEEWSLFCSGGAFAFLRPVDQLFRYLYSGVFATSYRDGDFFFKTSLIAKGEQYYANVLDLPDTFQNSVELQFSYDIDELTIFFYPMLSYDEEDYLEDNIRLSGEIGATFLLNERLITTGRAKGSMNAIPLHHSAYTGVFEIDLSYYPDIPLIATFSLGTCLSNSDYTEVVGSVPVKSLDNVQFFFGSDITVSFSDTITLKVGTPIKFSLKEMNAIRDGAFIDEREWTFVTSPEIELSFTLAKHHKLICTANCEPFFSNSDYYDNGYVECSLNYELDF